MGTVSKKARALSLRARGQSQSQVSRTLGISRTTLREWEREAGFSCPVARDREAETRQAATLLADGEPWNDVAARFDLTVGALRCRLRRAGILSKDLAAEWLSQGSKTVTSHPLGPARVSCHRCGASLGTVALTSSEDPDNPRPRFCGPCVSVRSERLQKPTGRGSKVLGSWLEQNRGKGHGDWTKPAEIVSDSQSQAKPTAPGLTDEQVAEVRQRLAEKQSVGQVSRALGLRRELVWEQQSLMAQERAMPTGKPVPPEVKAGAIKRIRRGDKFKEIAEDLGVSAASITSWARSAGISAEEARRFRAERRKRLKARKQAAEARRFRAERRKRLKAERRAPKPPAPEQHDDEDPQKINIIPAESAEASEQAPPEAEAHLAVDFNESPEPAPRSLREKAEETTSELDEAIAERERAETETEKAIAERQRAEGEKAKRRKPLWTTVREAADAERRKGDEKGAAEVEELRRRVAELEGERDKAKRNEAAAMQVLDEARKRLAAAEKAAEDAESRLVIVRRESSQDIHEARAARDRQAAKVEPKRRLLQIKARTRAEAAVSVIGFDLWTVISEAGVDEIDTDGVEHLANLMRDTVDALERLKAG